MKRRQRIQLTHDKPVDLWLDTERARDRLDNLIAETRVEFSSGTALLDQEGGVLAHTQRETIAAVAANGRPVTESDFTRALTAHRNDGEIAPSYADDMVALHCESASALSDLAKMRLAERGLRFGAPGYENAYVTEIATISRESGLRYHDNDKQATSRATLEISPDST
jgi:hypothetical protein